MVNQATEVTITTIQGQPLDAFPDDFPFRITVTLPENDAPPARTIQVELSTGVDSDTLTLSWDGNVGAPRYRSNPVTLDAGAEGGGTIQIGGGWSVFQFEFSTGGISPLDSEDGGTLTVEHEGTTATATVYESSHTMNIDRVLTIFDGQEAFWTSVQDQLEGSDDPEAQPLVDLADVKLRAIERGRNVIGNDNLWMSQRSAAAGFFLDIVTNATPDYDQRFESGVLNEVLDNARDQSLNVITDQFEVIVFGFYDVFTHATMAAQVVEICGIDIYGNELEFSDRVLAALDLGSGLALEAVGVVGGLQSISRGAGRGGPRQAASTGDIVNDVHHVDVGTPVSHIPYGILDTDIRHIRNTADEFGVVIEMRPANVDSMRWQTLGYPRKPVKIKQKTINEIDTHLGANPDNIGLVGYFEPQLPTNLDTMPPDLQVEIRGRHDQRLREFNDGKVELGGMQDAGKISLEDGLIVDRGLGSDSGLPFTGDLDPWRITKDGRQLDALEAQPIIDSLAAGPAQGQHGAHANWDAPPNLKHIDDKIRSGHKPTAQGGEGESLIAVGGHGTGPARATYSGIDVIPGSSAPDISTTPGGLASGGPVQTGAAAAGVRTGTAAGTAGETTDGPPATEDASTPSSGTPATGTATTPTPVSSADSPSAPGPLSAIPGGIRSVAAGVGGIVLLGGFLLFGGGGDNGTTTPTNSGNTGSSSSGSSSSSSSGSSGSSASSGGAAATATPTACELRREQPLVLEVSSADIPGGVIPEQHLKRGAYEFDFKTPSFQWSAVPPETTEIVILIMKFQDEEFAALQNDPDLRGDAIRRGTERWILSGLDPSLTSLGSTSLTVPPPAGAVEQKNQGPGVTPNGEPSNSKFVGPAFPERHFMFAVVALCDGGGTDRGSYRGFALGEDAIAMGWFFGEPPW